MKIASLLSLFIVVLAAMPMIIHAQDDACTDVTTALFDCFNNNNDSTQCQDCSNVLGDIPDGDDSISETGTDDGSFDCETIKQEFVGGTCDAAAVCCPPCKTEYLAYAQCSWDIMKTMLEAFAQLAGGDGGSGDTCSLDVDLAAECAAGGGGGGGSECPTTPCGEGSFCNYDFDTVGMCELCSDVEDCANDGLPSAGVEACLAVCGGGGGGGGSGGSMPTAAGTVWTVFVAVVGAAGAALLD